MRKSQIDTEVPIHSILKPVTKICGVTDHHYSETEGILSSQGIRSSQLRSKAGGKQLQQNRVSNLPQRKHPIPVEVKEEVVVPAKRNGLNRNQRARVKSKPEDFEKVSSLFLSIGLSKKFSST
jgi:hypothetical protein